MNTRTALTIIGALLLVHVTTIALLVYALVHVGGISFPLVRKPAVGHQQPAGFRVPADAGSFAQPPTRASCALSTGASNTAATAIAAHAAGGLPAFRISTFGFQLSAPAGPVSLRLNALARPNTRTHACARHARAYARQEMASGRPAATRFWLR
jgi:hypothetical protein